MYPVLHFRHTNSPNLTFMFSLTCQLLSSNWHMKAGKHIQHPTNTKSRSRKFRISPSFITCSDKLIVSATGQQTAERERTDVPCASGKCFQTSIADAKQTYSHTLTDWRRHADAQGMPPHFAFPIPLSGLSITLGKQRQSQGVNPQKTNIKSDPWKIKGH